MSAPVDVLAVMQEAELALQDFNLSVTWDKVRRARAAVAELIEAAADVERRAGPDREPKLRAALARVKGESK